MKPKTCSLTLIGLAILAFVLASGCSTVQVKTVTDPTANFEAYHTFNFKEPIQKFESTSLSETNRMRIQNALRQELEERGLTFSANPDVWATWYLKVAPKVLDLKRPTAEGESVGYTMQKYYGLMYSSDPSMTQQERIPYREGNLVIDLVDSRKGQVLWQAVVTGILDNNPSDETITKRIHEAVRSAFKKFPR